MGLLSIFEGIEDLFDSAKEFVEDIIEFKHDLDDINTSGFRGIFSGEEVECASDINKEADAIIANINEKYRGKYKNVQIKLQKLEEQRNVLYKAKKELAQAIRKNCNYMIHIPTQIAPFQLGMPREKTVDSVFMDIFVIPNLDLQSKLLITYSRASQRLEAAREYRENAKVYESKITKEIAKLNRLDSYAEKVFGIFKEESEILKVLVRSFEVNGTEERKAIVKDLEILLAESVLDVKGQINSKYEKAVHEMKTLL